MRGATRYVIRQIAGPLAFMTITLTSVVWLTQSLRLIERLVTNGIPFGSFLYLTGLLLPGLLVVILPIALFCATLYAYNRMTTDSELVVLWAAGFSKWALALPALLVAALLTLAGYALTLYLVPLGTSSFRSTQFEFRSNIANLLIQEGVFNTPMSGLTVYVRERLPSGEMLGIFVHDNRDASRPMTMMAERGALIRTPQGPRFVLGNGNRQQIEHDRNQVSMLHFESYSLDLDLYAKNEGAGWRQPNERFIDELFWPDMSDPDDRANYWRLVVQGHRNLATPLYTFALAMIALASLLSGEFNRRGQSRRIMVAAACGIAAQVMALATQHLATRAPVTIPLIYITPLAFAALAAYVLARHPRRHGASALGPA